MNPTVLSWALAQGVGNRWRAMAEAYTSGVTRVTYEGRTVEYRSLDEIGRALASGYSSENTATRRPSVTYATFARAT